MEIIRNDLLELINKKKKFPTGFVVVYLYDIIIIIK